MIARVRSRFPKRAGWVASAAVALSVSASEVPAPFSMADGGRLVSHADPGGSLPPDFSHAGFGGGGAALPFPPELVVLGPADGDDGPRIQAAIDLVSKTPAEATGPRGAVRLLPGVYQISGRLRIHDGVALRGSGNGEEGTVLHATGTDRRTLIELGGPSLPPPFGDPVELIDPRVPVGSTRITLATADALAPGDSITIRRPSTAAWITSLGMDDSPGRTGLSWKPGTLDVTWNRTVRKVDGSVITLDAPLTLALDKNEGNAVIQRRKPDARASFCGVEHLRCVSQVDSANPLDEQHAWNAIDIGAVRDAWVADVTAEHFAGSAVLVTGPATRVTVQDCLSLAPVSELAGFRRMAFHSRGEQVLFLRCESRQGRADFSTGCLAAGPTVFLDCTASESTGASGPLGSWASGVLFDGVRIDGGTLRLDNLETSRHGIGWAAANSILWNSSADRIICRSPRAAPNRAVGVWGQLVGDGRWSETHRFVRPRSLYQAQLTARLGPGACDALKPRRYPTAAGEVTAIEVPALSAPPDRGPLEVVDGILTIDGRSLAGSSVETAWWRGRVEPDRAAANGPAITRFAPGFHGPGLTDDLKQLVKSMRSNGQVVFRHHPGLWYDRRRDDHQMTRRPDADVWPPFFEQPFARSGTGTAWDGLSRYDLTRFNPWYFDRLLEFAREARSGGVVLFNEMYFQHNLLESGAHWVDSPWRPTNHINDTGFTEPPPFEGDRIRMAAEFYDTTHPGRRELHRAYIRHHLDMLGGEANVVHSLTAENSGPLGIMQFWIDVIAEWEKETGRHPLIALSATKDVQDAILADPARAAVIDVIDLSYWFRTDAGREFAPPGGVERSPRQHLREWKHGRPSAASIAAMAAEYRRRFPAKAVISFLPEATNIQP